MVEAIHELPLLTGIDNSNLNFSRGRKDKADNSPQLYEGLLLKTAVGTTAWHTKGGPGVSGDFIRRSLAKANEIARR